MFEHDPIGRRHWPISKGRGVQVKGEILNSRALICQNNYS